MIKNLEFRLLDAKKLTEDLGLSQKTQRLDQKANLLDEFLKNSFRHAKEVRFDTLAPESPQTVQLIDDNPLYNYARFYNPNFDFNFPFSFPPYDRQNLSSVKMYASLPEHTSSFAEHSTVAAFQRIHWCNEIEGDSAAKTLAEKAKQIMLGKSWTIAHRILSDTKPLFDEIESLKMLKTNMSYAGFGFTSGSDIALLRNDGFTFWTLQPDPSKKNIPYFLMTGDDLLENTIDFSDIPLVSCSIDLQNSITKEEATACFNGSSEEVKKQVITYYINKFCEKNGLEKFKELKAEELAQNCTDMIHRDELEVRIPTHRKVNSWKKVGASESMPTSIPKSPGLGSSGQGLENYTEYGGGIESDDEDQESASSEDSEEWLSDKEDADDKSSANKHPQQEGLNRLNFDSWEDFDNFI